MMRLLFGLVLITACVADGANGTQFGTTEQAVQTVNYLQRWNGTTYIDSVVDDGATAAGVVTITGKSLAINTDGQTELISTHYATGTDGNNIFVGYGGQSVTGSGAQGSSNASLGFNALPALTTGAYNTAMGMDSMEACTGCIDNVAVGQAAELSLTTGIENTAIGVQALELDTTGSFNTAIGLNALQFTTGANNTAIGLQAGEHNTSGGASTFIGVDAGQNSTGSNNTIIGTQAGAAVTSGDLNTIIGRNSGGGITTGRANTIIGPTGTLSTTLSNAVIISDGDGNQRISVDSSGNTTLSGSVRLKGSGPTIYSGSGAPAINCAVGDLFLRTDGSTSTTFNVCTSTNTWTAK